MSRLPLPSSIPSSAASDSAGARVSDPFPRIPDSLEAGATIAIRPWKDELIDTLGHDPRSAYVEQFWLGILGPSTTWLLRRVASAFDRAPDGFWLPLADTARELGLGDKGGRHSPFIRALARLCQFDVARGGPDDSLEVRRHVPPLTRRQIVRLPAALRDSHEAWQRSQLGAPNAVDLRHRARQLALSLAQMGEDEASTERQLLQWRFHPGLAQEAVRWARERQQAALVAAGEIEGGDQGLGMTPRPRIGDTKAACPSASAHG